MLWPLLSATVLSGTTGYGFPEAPTGQVVAAVLFGLCAWCLWVRGAEASIRRKQRGKMVALAVVVSHLWFLFVRNLVMWIAYALGGPIAIATGAGAIAVGTMIVVGPLARRWRIPGMVAATVVVGAAVGVLIGVVVDMQVYWYEWRNEAGTSTKWLSFLELAVATTTTVLASYLFSSKWHDPNANVHGS